MVHAGYNFETFFAGEIPHQKNTFPLVLEKTLVVSTEPLREAEVGGVSDKEADSAQQRISPSPPNIEQQ